MKLGRNRLRNLTCHPPKCHLISPAWSATVSPPAYCDIGKETEIYKGCDFGQPRSNAVSVLMPRTLGSSPWVQEAGPSRVHPHISNPYSGDGGQQRDCLDRRGS